MKWADSRRKRHTSKCAGTETLGLQIDFCSGLSQGGINIRKQLTECRQAFSAQLFYRGIRANTAEVETKPAPNRVCDVQGERTVRCVRVRNTALKGTRYLDCAVDRVDARTSSVP